MGAFYQRLPVPQRVQQRKDGVGQVARHHGRRRCAGHGEAQERELTRHRGDRDHRGGAKAGPRLSAASAISQTAATAAMKTGTARIWVRFGGPPRTSRAAITTRLPVTWAVNSPRLKYPITSTLPAITLSKVGSLSSSLWVMTSPRDRWRASGE